MIKRRLTFLSCLLLSTLAFGNARAWVPLDQFETRCGWFDNPTPANVWLIDRDGQWIIGAQGGYQVEGDWDWPAFKPRQWVETNGHYGYGCACLRLRVNKETRRVVEIKSARARPLSSCQRDARLERRHPEPD